MAGVPDWTRPVGITTAKLNVTRITTVDIVTQINKATTTEVINKATTILEVGDRLHYLGSSSWAAGDGTSFRHSFSVPYSATAMMVRVRSVTGVVPHCAAVQAINAITISVVQFGAAFEMTVDTLGYTYSAIVPCGSFAGGKATVIVYLSTTGTSTVFMEPFALTSNPGVQLRSDGRAYPIGSHHASVGSSTTGTHTLVAAPTSPLRLLVRTLSVQSAATAVADVAGTVGGTFQALIYNEGSMATSREPNGGLLLDAGTGLTLRLTAAYGVHAQVSYDIVV